eukprot:TRINITY_DN1234_c1_g1_i1.p2 TRINITY_DN1234_c1_g1~~TRINITY_DN1234_c1_g1_i1.p2  ORF type:complete len:204 (-),score=4.45 TRINITY_DN1234_c1_g1_i1:474-1085(-)
MFKPVKYKFGYESLQIRLLAGKIIKKKQYFTKIITLKFPWQFKPNQNAFLVSNFQPGNIQFTKNQAQLYLLLDSSEDIIFEINIQEKIQAKFRGFFYLQQKPFTILQKSNTKKNNCIILYYYNCKIILCIVLIMLITFFQHNFIHNSRFSIFQNQIKQFFVKSNKMKKQNLKPWFVCPLYMHACKDTCTMSCIKKKPKPKTYI